MLKKIKLLSGFMRGNRLLYFQAIIALAVATIFSLISPLILRLSIDSIIGDEPMAQIPEWVQESIQVVGGTSVLAQNLWIMSILLVLLALGNGILLFYKGKWSAVASESIARNMRDRLYNHLQHLTYEYHVKVETGDLIQRCTSDVETIRNSLATQIVEIGRTVFMLAVVLPIMLSLNTAMTAISLLVSPVLFISSVIFFRKVKQAFKLSDEAEGKLSTVLQENLTGVRVVRAFARQLFEINKFDSRNENYRDITYRLILLFSWYWSLSDLLCLSQIGLVLVVGTVWVINGVMTLGTFVAFTAYVGMLLWPIRQLGKILTNLGKTYVALDRIQEILDEAPEHKVNGSLKPKFQGALEFKDVSFEYETGKPVLKNISFRAESGQTIAIMGPTGSGKSTLVNLLSRLYEYNSGSIKIDGFELKNIDKKWLRQNVGIVLQEPFLFSKTVKDNIRLARPDADDAQIFNAAQVAAVHDVILGFENGYDTAVGEKGVTLSGGQKQRVAISRTLLKESPFLIFDDSLSAVDTETDLAIRRALRSNGCQATTFIISHRVATLSEADLIMVLENGELIQSGTHDKLIDEPGLYRRIWSIQNSLETEFEEKRDYVMT